MFHGLWVIIKILLSIIGILFAIALLLLLLVLFVPIRYRFDGTYKLLQKGAHCNASWLGPVLRFESKVNANGVYYCLKFLGFTIYTSETERSEK